MVSLSKAVLVLFLASLLTACGGSSSGSEVIAKHPDSSVTALARIIAYADDSSNPSPTIADYENAGITGVNSSNLVHYNEAVNNVSGEAVDTIEELRAVTSGLNTEKPNTQKPPVVTDVTKPVITLEGSATITLTVGESYTDEGATANDNKDGNISSTIIKMGEVDTTKVGSYTITYNVADEAGNAAAEITRTVVINPVPNTAPVISGIPNLETNIYNQYQFQPSANDIDNNVLTFSIENKPSWASFDSATGRLEGTVPEASESTYSNIAIAVSDGKETVSLPRFNITVSTELDIAHKFGIATQGGSPSYYYYKDASFAIDGDDITVNHTEGTSENNWWQVKLPSSTDISKVVIRGHAYNTYRLSGAKVYITQSAYTGTLNEADNVATLAGTGAEQLTTFVEPRTGNYLLIKGHSTNHIHVASVKVYGTTPVAPLFNAHERNYLVPINAAIGSKITGLTATDYQGDTLNYSLDNSMFAIDNEGNVTVNSVLASGEQTVTVTVSDGVNISSTILTIGITSSSAIEDVLTSGDVISTPITEEELIQATLDELTSLRVGESLLTTMYRDEAISYTPGQSTQLIQIHGDAHKIFPILQGNKGETLAAAGTNKNSRFAAFGTNPMLIFESGGSLSFEPQFQRLLSWLLASENETTTNLSKVIALSFADNEAQAIKNWLATNYTNWSVIDCNDTAALTSCYSNANLLITSWETDEDNTRVVSQALEAELDKGTPVMYINSGSWSSNKVADDIADLLKFSLPYGGNYWSIDKAIWSNVAMMQASVFASKRFEAIETMFTHFKNADYNFDWAQCQDSGGTKGSEYDSCSEVPGLPEFEEASDDVKSMIDALDTSKEQIFNDDDYRLQKLLVLTADKFRQKVSYPMDKVTTSDHGFMKSYFADHAIYNYRKINHAQTDLGNFSRSDFSHITPVTKVVNVMSKKNFRATGAYALPGQTVKVTRNDSSDLTVKVFVNTQRSIATHQYQVNAYNRPKHLKTPSMEIKPGESIELTSPYGGTLQLEFTTNDLPVEIKFENVGEHAFWASSADDASFARKLQANEFDWAEIATAGFEVHSKLDKMITSVEDDKWGGTAAGLAEAVVKYTSNYPHVLAGFKGNGVDVVPEIHDWANDKGLTIETIDTVKHMNADQAGCGYGCSGNPYDAYWSFNPIGHGDIHELGHSLQKKRFEGFPNHAATNTFSFYTKSRYFENTSSENECGGQPFEGLYATIQGSVGNSDVEAYLKTNLWDTAGLGEQYLLKIQAMMHAQKLGKLENGWHVLARVHILEREMSRAKQDWDNKKDAVGFSTYSLDEINAIRDNDWLVVAYSYAAGLDYRNYFDMMGIPYTQKARDQVASFGFTVVPNALFLSTDGGYCDSDEYGILFDKPTIPVDGTSVWPE